ncbi:protein HHL1, chloroplastic-like [Rutidosis leptorrhynchoides]|uniref:protein HHL1, chloroplastic-like n=1 Tax=Rutidosis leptorrhynchoides TaxID=125765 RepID=UPI003A98F25F
MEVCMSLKPHYSLPRTTTTTIDDSQLIIRHSFSSSQIQKKQHGKSCRLMVIEAKGKKGMQARQFQRQMPAMPKIEDDGNPRFVIFIRMANVYLWYPVSIVAGGTTAKILLAGKDNFVGKYIYKDTLSKNLAGVIYKDEKEVQKTAVRQHRVLRAATDFRYGYKIVEGTNIRAALASNDVIELPTKAELKTVLDKVLDFFGDAKESFGKLTDLTSSSDESEETTSDEKSKIKS